MCQEQAPAEWEVSPEDDKASDLSLERRSGCAEAAALRSNILSAMLTTRRASVDDSSLITRHRKAMFADARNAPEDVLEAMSSEL